MKILTAEQVKQVDQECARQGTPTSVLMENAGKAVAEETRRSLGTMENQHGVLMQKGPARISPFFVPMMIVNMVTGMISMRFGAKGPTNSTVSACASGANAIGDGFRIIQYGDADVMIVGGAEAPVTPVAVGGFASMKALSTRNDDPGRASRPFDADRDGFLIGEVGGEWVWVDENGDPISESGNPIYGGESVRVSGGTLVTGEGGEINLSAEQDILLLGMVGQVYELDSAPAVDVDVVNINSFSGDVVVFELINSRNAINISGRNIDVVGREP